MKKELELQFLSLDDLKSFMPNIKSTGWMNVLLVQLSLFEEEEDKENFGWVYWEETLCLAAGT